MMFQLMTFFKVFRNFLHYFDYFRLQQAEIVQLFREIALHVSAIFLDALDLFPGYSQPGKFMIPSSFPLEPGIGSKGLWYRDLVSLGAGRLVHPMHDAGIVVSRFLKLT